MTEAQNELTEIGMNTSKTFNPKVGVMKAIFLEVQETSHMK